MGYSKVSIDITNRILDCSKLLVAVGTTITDRPPEQIRICAFTHTAPIKDEEPRSVRQGKDAVCEVEESIDSRSR